MFAVALGLCFLVSAVEPAPAGEAAGTDPEVAPAPADAPQTGDAGPAPGLDDERAPAAPQTGDPAPAPRLDDERDPAAPQAFDDERPGPARRTDARDLAPPAPEPSGLRLPGTYLHVAPGIAAFNALDPAFRFYAWGISGGRSVVRGRRFAAQLGGFFEHLVGPRQPAVDLVRFGGEFRVGASNERVFGYGLARAGLDILVVPKDMFAGPGRRAPLFFLVSLGAGVQGALGPRRRLLLGVEPSFEFTWPGVLVLFRTRAFVGWRFG